MQTKPLLLASAWLFLAGVWASGPESSASAQAGQTYFVDFSAGSNTASGMTSGAPWKHAPGDLDATDQPARARLKPGDVIQFRGNVAYRGTLTVRAAGTAEAAVVYRGQGWGGRATLTGRDEVMVDLKPCAAVAGCSALGLNADNLLAAELPQGIDARSQIVLDGRVLSLAQSPPLADPFFADDISTYHAVGSAAVRAFGSGWHLTHAKLASIAAGSGQQDMFLYLWGMPNLIYEARITALEPGGSVLVEAGRFQPYGDRDTRFAIVNHPSSLHNPGDYATIAGGRLLIVKDPAGPRRASLEVSRRPFAIDASQASHTVFDGFVIEGYAGGSSDQKGGVALWLNGRARAIAFRNNEVRELDSRAGSGAVQANAVDGLQLEGNRFERLRYGSGIRTGQGARNVVIVGNHMRRLGRTGIAIIASQSVVVRDNRIEGVRGIHGNAVSVYLGTKNVNVSNNLIMDSTRGVTFHGAGGTPNDIVLGKNIISVSGPSSVGIQSWGKGTNGVEITGNVVLAPSNRVAVHLDGGDRNVRLVDNFLETLFVQGSIPTDWRVTGNTVARTPPSNFRGAASTSETNRTDPKLFLAIRSAGVTDSPAFCRALADAMLRGTGPASLCR